MTTNDLHKFGYGSYPYKNGTVYLKDNFVVLFTDKEGVVDFKLYYEDSISLGTARTIHELAQLEKKVYQEKLQKLDEHRDYLLNQIESYDNW